jgi:hypothetical protein
LKALTMTIRRASQRRTSARRAWAEAVRSALSRFCRGRGALLLAAACLLGAPGGRAQRVEKLSREDALAYFTLNCAYFGLWPAAIDPQQTKLLKIGILGRSDLAESLRAVAERAKATWYRGGEIVFRQGDKAADISDCHIVFLGELADSDLAAALAVFDDRPVLLVSESKGFVEKGGSVGVHIEREALRFDINLDRLRAQNIVLDSKFRGKAAAYISDGHREENPGRAGGHP